MFGKLVKLRTRTLPEHCLCTDIYSFSVHRAKITAGKCRLKSENDFQIFLEESIYVLVEGDCGDKI
jgi:hypothetical protein